MSVDCLSQWRNNMVKNAYYIYTLKEKIFYFPQGLAKQ